MSIPKDEQRALLLHVARKEMLQRGFEPDFSEQALAEADRIEAPEAPFPSDVRDLRNLLWCSIDNDDSRDLDQLTLATRDDGSDITIMVAVADVSELVKKGSAVDEHAVTNTTSVYTPPQIFPMLPERLSTDLSSLNPGEDRLAMVVQTIVHEDGRTGASTVFRAVVHNHAKLAYPSVGAWLEGEGEMPDAMREVPGLAEAIRLQDAAAQRLRSYRSEQGALELETIQVKAKFDGNAVTGLVAEGGNRAKEIIEDFMIATNGVTARFLTERRFPVVRRIVRSPDRWQRIVDIALEHGEQLPSQPDSKALHAFLIERRAADPLRFPDLSLSIIKLLGRGEYVATFQGMDAEGHFGLAVSDYTHSTAPNRRYPDLITQRLLKAALLKQAVPYGREELETLATHCTRKEDDAQKVERLLRKAAAACLLDGQIGREFDGLVTGASPKGTWARIFDPPIEGRVTQGFQGLDVGERVRVKLVHTDPERGFIDFARVGGHDGGRHARQQ